MVRFSRTVRLPKTLLTCGRYAIFLRAMWWGAMCVISSPPARMLPEYTVHRPKRLLSSVLLPEPLGPMIRVSSRSRASKSTPNRMCAWP